jgi:DNA polymerase IV
MDFTTITRSQTIMAATDADQVIFATGLTLLRKEIAKNRQMVRLIGIGVSSLTEGSRQLDMLDKASVRFENLNRALDRIRRKHGFESIKTGRALSLKDIFTDTGNDDPPL